MKRMLPGLMLLLVFLSARAQTPLTTATDFTVTTVEGTTFNLYNTLAQNKYVLIDFFYYGCVPCQQTAPKVDGAYQNFGCNSSNVFFIGINNGDNTATTIAFGNDFGAGYPAASGTDGGANAVVTAYGITAFPTVILIAPDHSIPEQDIWPIADAAYLNTLIAGHGGVAATCTSGINTREMPGENGMNFLNPNPATDQTTVNFFTKQTTTVTFEVRNLTGQLLYTSTKLSAAGDHQEIIPCNDLANGFYLIRMLTDNTVADQKKLTIAR